VSKFRRKIRTLNILGGFSVHPNKPVAVGPPALPGFGVRDSSIAVVGPTSNTAVVFLFHPERQACASRSIRGGEALPTAEPAPGLTRLFLTPARLAASTLAAELGKPAQRPAPECTPAQNNARQNHPCVVILSGSVRSWPGEALIRGTDLLQVHKLFFFSPPRTTTMGLITFRQAKFAEKSDIRLAPNPGGSQRYIGVAHPRCVSVATNFPATNINTFRGVESPPRSAQPIQ